MVHVSTRGEGRLHRRGGPLPTAPRRALPAGTRFTLPTTHPPEGALRGGQLHWLPDSSSWHPCGFCRSLASSDLQRPPPPPSAGVPPRSLLRLLHFPTSSYTASTQLPQPAVPPPARDVTRGLSFSGLSHLACTMPLRSTQVVTSGRVPFFLG